MNMSQYELEILDMVSSCPLCGHTELNIVYPIAGYGMLKSSIRKIVNIGFL